MKKTRRTLENIGAELIEISGNKATIKFKQMWFDDNEEMVITKKNIKENKTGKYVKLPLWGKDENGVNWADSGTTVYI